MSKIKLGDITKIRTGKLDANASSENGTYPFFTCSKDPLRINSYSYDCECVLVAGNGDLNVKYYKGKFDAYQRTYIIEDNSSGRLYLPYLYYFLELYVEELRKQSIGGVIKYIKLGNLTDAILELPSMEEQKAIVNILDKSKRMIESKNELLQSYDQLIKSRFVEMFGDVSQKENGFTLNDVCEKMVRGPFGSSLKKEYFVPEGSTTYKVYEQKHAINREINIGDYYIDSQKFNELKRFEVKPGDVIMSCSGTIGKFFVIPRKAKPGIINQALLNFKLNESLINHEYFLQSMYLIISTIESKGSGIANITSVNNIKKTNLFLPTLTEQNKFSEFVQQVDKLEFNE